MAVNCVTGQKRTLLTPSAPERRQREDNGQQPDALPTFSQMIDVELQAIWAYLRALPTLPDNK